MYSKLQTVDVLVTLLDTFSLDFLVKENYDYDDDCLKRVKFETKQYSTCRAFQSNQRVHLTRKIYSLILKHRK